MSNPFMKTFAREINRMVSKPIILILLFIFPIVTSIVFCDTFKAGIPKDLPIAVLDEDNSDLSRKIVRMVDATPTCQVKYNVSSAQEGKDLIVEGKIYAFILIPREFKKDIFKAKRPQLVYYYNNQMLLIGGSITKDVNVAIQTVMGGITSKLYSRNAVPTEVAISRVNVIKVDEHVLSNPYINYSYMLIIAALIHTFQILICFLAIWAIGSEFKDGTTKEWLECANGSVLTSVFAKLLPYTISFTLLIALIYWGYFVIYGAPFNGSIPFTLASTVLFILAYQLTGMAFVAISGNLRFSLSSGAFYTSLGFTLAGMTYPSIAMPTIMRFYSALLPLRPYLAIVVDQSQRGFPINYDFGYFMWIFALAIFGAIFMPLLKKKMQDETQWYKI